MWYEFFGFKNNTVNSNTYLRDLVVEAVQCELVSVWIACFTGYLQGIFMFLLAEGVFLLGTMACLQ